MNKQTYQFHEPGSIPGIPGEFHAGMEVDIDTDTMTILGQRLMRASDTPETSIDEQSIQQLASIDEAKTSKVKGAKG